MDIVIIMLCVALIMGTLADIYIVVTNKSEKIVKCKQCRHNRYCTQDVDFDNEENPFQKIEYCSRGEKW